MLRSYVDELTTKLHSVVILAMCLLTLWLNFSIEINVRISDGGKSGKLEFQDNGGSWGAVCLDGFDQDAADVACRQLGYSQASELYTYYSSYYSRYAWYYIKNVIGMSLSKSHHAWSMVKFVVWYIIPYMVQK